ncbi:hypothetical protein BIW11_10287, partial [Tropilaelaps mercedesae]
QILHTWLTIHYGNANGALAQRPVCHSALSCAVIGATYRLTTSSLISPVLSSLSLAARTAGATRAPQIEPISPKLSTPFTAHLFLSELLVTVPKDKLTLMNQTRFRTHRQLADFCEELSSSSFVGHRGKIGETTKN